MALAGPLANLLLVIVAIVLIRTGMLIDVFYPPNQIAFAQIVEASAAGIWGPLATLLSILFTLNLLLFIFNLIPLPPLDGSGVVALLASEERARRLHALMRQPQFSMLGLIVAWFAIGPLFRPIFLAAVNLLYPEFSYG